MHTPIFFLLSVVTDVDPPTVPGQTDGSSTQNRITDDTPMTSGNEENGSLVVIVIVVVIIALLVLGIVGAAVGLAMFMRWRRSRSKTSSTHDTFVIGAYTHTS